MSYRALPQEIQKSSLGRRLGLLVTFLTLCTAQGWAQTAPVERELTAAAEPCLDLHSGPDSMSPVARCLPTGSGMNLLESRNGWARVRLVTGEEGWVEFRLVRPAIAGEPVRVAPPRAEGVAAERRRIARLESALAAAAVERNELQRGTSALRGEIYELRLANESLLAVAAEREAAEAASVRQVAELEAAEAASAGQVAELEAALVAAASEAEAAAAEAQELRETVAGLESESSDREARLEDLAGRLEAAEQLLSEADSKRRESVAELEVLWREETALRERAEAEAARLASEQAAFRDEAEELRQANERLADEARTLERVRSEADRRIEELESALAQAETARSELEANQEDSEFDSRVELLEEALGAAEAERRRLERDQLELREQLERLAAANEWLSMAAVEQPSVVSVAAASPREYGGASEPDDPGTTVTELLSAPVEPEPQPEPSPALPQIEDPTEVVQAWARAWSEQRVEDYLSFYSRGFVPADSSSREEWEALRRQRVAGPEWVDVRVALADLKPLGDDRMAVVFLQSYESNLMTDVVLKTLEMVREDGGWKIAAELVQ